MAGSNWGWKHGSFSLSHPWQKATGSMEADGRFSLTHSPASTWDLNACPGARLEKRSALFIWGGSKLQKNLEPVVSLIMVWTKQMQKQRILFVQKDVLYIVKKKKEILINSNRYDVFVFLLLLGATKICEWINYSFSGHLYVLLFYSQTSFSPA